ncbi:P-type Ca(2+) transporter [Malassezia cuniculi]|uniref:Calcium-transporting ATPase n=1 Tax=Malassezia cuniculi TaxID=948313 RepID=A0AAF0JDC2_9BASI|nr:P-type Ca(2+) transporter [Malassezia cuniculi]
MAAAVESLLKGGIAQIPRYGFTLDAIKAGTPSAAQYSHSLHALFPGPDHKPTSAARRLFGAWDAEAHKKTIIPVQSPPGSRKEAYSKALDMLANRLDVSAQVQQHLLPAFALLSTYPVADASIGRLVPMLTPILKALPTTGNIVDPIPMAHRAITLADAACVAAEWKGEHGPEWYEVRLRLGFAYGAAALHMTTETSHTASEGRSPATEATAPHAAPPINNDLYFLGQATGSSLEPKDEQFTPSIPTAHAPSSETALSEKQQLSTYGGTVDNASDLKERTQYDDASKIPQTKEALKVDEEDPNEKSTWRTRYHHFMTWFKGRSDEQFQLKIKAQLKQQLGRDPTPFKFKPGQLCDLVDPENIEMLREMGGINGLTEGLGTDAERGITTDDDDGAARNSTKNFGTVDERIHVYGSNVLPARKPKNLLLLMWIALQDKILILLIVAAIVSLSLGLYTDFGREPEQVPCDDPPPGRTTCDAAKVNYVEGVAIMVAVVIVDLVGSLNDWQKERQFRLLDAKKEARDVTVIRNGSEIRLDVHDVVVGDVVRFEPGEILAFDGVLVRGHNVKCDESSVTGESDMIVKYTYDDALQMIEKDSLNPTKKKNRSCFMISGAKVVEGVGDFLVTAVGPLSFNGKLMMSLRQEPENTPLQAKLNMLADVIAKLGSAAGLVLFVALMIRFFVQLGRDKSGSGSEAADFPNSSRSGNSEDYADRFINILIISVTIVVVAVPEGLPLAVTLALAFATRRMSNSNLLVRVLSSCETMANATVICTDKTGTLTQNNMNVVAGCIGKDWRFQDAVKFEIDGGDHEQGNLSRLQDIPEALPEPLQKLLNDSICINSTAFVPDNKSEHVPAVEKVPTNFLGLDKYLPFLREKPKEEPAHETDAFMGSKTETALLYMARKLGWENYKTVRDSAKIVQLVPFSSARKAMGIVIEQPNGKFRFFSKGASEVLLGQCTSVVTLGSSAELETEPLTKEDKANMGEVISGYANQSLRTISLCFRDFSQWPPPDAPLVNEGEVDYAYLAQELTLITITAIEDPLRPGVAEAVRACGRAGVQVKMCTGDNIITAKSIAKQCGIYTPGGIVIEGPFFRRLSDEDLTYVAPRLQVLARSSPEDKKKLTEKLKSMGDIVAVTGDGTNDGPALKAANVGFSMGIAGSEVAKEASDIILLDDNFSSIVRAIMWGRCVNDAVRKFLQFQFTVNIVAVVVTFISAVSSDEEKSVLTAVQLLWLNLIMDTLAALALATDPADESMLDRKPGHVNAALVTTRMWMHIIIQSIYQIILVLVLVFRGGDILNMAKAGQEGEVHDNVEKSALIFNVFVWCQLFNQINARRLDTGLNIFHGMHKNLWFILIICIEAAAQVLIIFKGGHAFNVQAINGRDWGISIIAGLVSWPLGVLTRLIPVEWVERPLIAMHLMRDPNAPLQPRDMEKNAPVLEWNEPAIGAVAERLNHFSRIRGGRLRASNMVLKTKSQQMKDKDVHPHSLMALVPTLIGASLGGAWRPRANEGKDDPEAPISLKDMFDQGKIAMHPDTPEDDEVFLYIKNGGHTYKHA